MHRHGDTPNHFRLFGWETVLIPAALSEDPIQGKGIGSRTHGTPAEIFFHVYATTARFTYNTDNSEATGYVRNLLGFPGFLMVQTFYSPVTNNMMPYNKSLALSQCYPVLYRLTREQIWLDKTQKAWNWFNDGIQKDDEAWWWYYSKYWDWNRLNPTLSQNVTDKPEEELGYYEDYEGHYSVDLMFLIEAHKIGVLNDGDLYEISKNKKVYGLKKDGWTYIMKSESREKDNLKAAVYFDYFVTVLGENDYCDIVFPVLKKEIEEQNMQNILADESTGNNGTCLRLLASAVLANMNETSMEK